MAGPPPAALAAFLGCAPSEAALRRPGSARPQSSAGRPQTAASAASRDSSPDSCPDVPDLPTYDGGFDEGDLDKLAPVPEVGVMMVPGGGAVTSSKGTRGHRTLPPRAPGAEVLNLEGGPTGSVAYPQPEKRRSEKKRSGGASPGTDFSKTATPGPASLSCMLGEDAASAALRASSGGDLNSSGEFRRTNGSGSATPNSRRNSTPQRSPGSADGRPRSGSARRGAGEGQEAPSVVAAALDLDPLGSTGRRRFGGRG